jgi:hypothetical protein
MGPNPNQAWANIVASVLRPAPEPTHAERANPIVLAERCRRAGFTLGQTALLVVLAPEKVSEACELVEGGADPYIAGRIVL